MVAFTLAPPRLQAPLKSLPFHEWKLLDGTLWTQFYRNETGFMLRFPDLADFEVSVDGHEVSCWPAFDVSDSSVDHLYLNQVLPLALSKQRKLVFHGSAVEIGTAGVAFMGESGRGKSTLAASFATNGFRFLTEDVLVVEPADEESLIMPSNPSIRLWDDSEKALIKASTSKAPPAQFTSKSRFMAGDEIFFCGQPRPLRRVYFLGDGIHKQPVFERINQSEALYALVKNSFLLDIEERETLAAQFDDLSRLVREPLYYRLDYPRRFEDLAKVRQAIVDHAMYQDQTA